MCAVYYQSTLVVTECILFHSQSISSDRWRVLPLAADSSRYPVAIFDALSSWLTCSGSGQVSFTDTCQGTRTYGIVQYAGPILVDS